MNCASALPPRSARSEQRVERALPFSDLLQPRVTQAPVPIESHVPVEVAVLDQQHDGAAAAGGLFDGLLEVVAAEAAIVHRDELVADGHTCVEGRAVPE